MADEKDVTLEMPQDKPGSLEIAAPAEMRSTIHRQGNNHFEIDTPSFKGRRSVRTFFGLLGTYYGGSLSLLILSIVRLAHGDNWWIFGLCGALVILLFAVFGASRGAIASCTHQNLVITATEFHIKRTIEFHSVAKDSINHPDRAAEALTRKDRWFCKQQSGRRSELTEAAIVETVKCRKPCYTLHLNAGDTQYCLEMQFEKQEREYLAAQINSFLQNDAASHA